jgi:hypothetical protein
MPIDPSLITDTMAHWQVPQIQIPDPLANYAKLQALRNGVVQQQLQQLDLQEKQRDISGRQALASAIQQSVKPGQNGAPPTIDHNNVTQVLLGGPHADLIPSYMQGVTKQQADQEAVRKTQLENQTSSLDLATRSFGAAKNQQDWDQSLATAHGLGVNTQAIGIPDVYSPEAQAKVVQFGLSTKDKLAADAAAQTSQSRADTVDLARDRLSDERIERTLNAAAGATNQAELDAARNQALKTGASPAQVNAIPMTFDPAAIAQYQRARLNPEQRTQADQAAATAAATAAAHTETARHNRVQESIEATRNQLQQSAARGDRSYQAATHELDQIGKPITDAVARLGKLQDTLAQNSPQADALVAPELMSIMAGGAGSGLRMNEAEIERVIGGRSKWQDLQAAVNKWQLDPSKANSITPDQRRQIHDLTQAVSDKLYAKQNALNDAYKTVAGSQDVNDHRQAVLGVRQAIANVDAGGAAGGAAATGGGAVTVTDPTGTVHTFRNQADADKFKSLAGIK